MTGEERVFVRTDAVPIMVPRLSGPDLRRWQARLWPDHVYYRWTWTCDHQHRWPAGASRCAGRMLRLLEQYAEGDQFAGERIREAGGWSEDRP